MPTWWTAASLWLYRLFSALLLGAHRVLRGEPGGRPADLSRSFPVGWDLLQSQSGRRSIVVFAATLGEFNAVRSLIDRCRALWPGDRIVAFTAQSQYVDSISRIYPDIIVGDPSFDEMRRWDLFVSLAGPRIVLFSEGPSLFCRFPLRLGLALPVACLAHRIPLFVVNAKVYEEAFSSRADRLEYLLFRHLHRQAVSRWYVATNSFRDDLVRAKVPDSRILVTGDVKFDNLTRPAEPPGRNLARILEAYGAIGAPIVVAGSVNAIDDQTAVVRAWLELRERYPGARLVLAPRYVNRPEALQPFMEFLRAEGLRFQLRSQAGTRTGDEPSDILIIDVFGELLHYYRIASLCYVGRNHGVLEPLQYKKPTVVAADWRADHPSYPLYQTVVGSKAVIQVVDKKELGMIFARILSDPQWSSQYVEHASTMIAGLSGGSDRVIESIYSIVE